MANKYDDPTKRRTLVVKARINQAEKDKLTELVKKMDMSEAEFIRYIIDNFDYEYFKN